MTEPNWGLKTVSLCGQVTETKSISFFSDLKNMETSRALQNHTLLANS
jgi:hypothetical protein